MIADLVPRARIRNPYARMTGDGLTHAAHRIATSRRRLAAEETWRLIEAFADTQDRGEDERARRSLRAVLASERPLVRRIHEELERLSLEYREGL